MASALLAAAALVSTQPVWAKEARLLDGFEDAATWKAAPADGVAMKLSPAPGRNGAGLRFDFDFQGHAGYAIARRELPLELPENYEISFQLRADPAGALVNTLEVKLVDPGGQNVWWRNQRDFHFPAEWTPVRIKKRQVTFAWGPAGGGEIRKLGSLEIVVTAGSGEPGTGGHGTIYLDDLVLKELPPADRPTPPVRFSATSAQPGAEAGRMGDGDLQTCWYSDRQGGEAQRIDLDLGTTREFGALSIAWCGEHFARDYDLLLSDDGSAWRKAAQVREGLGGKRLLYLPESEARFARLELTRTSRGRGYGIAEIGVEPLAVAATPNAFFTALARQRPRGTFPRAYNSEQSYWTLVGTYGGPERALLGEDGALELGETPASIEPFLEVDGKLLAWADVEVGQSLEDGDLPIPTVTWKAGGITLRVTPVVSEVGGRHVLFARYQVEQNPGGLDDLVSSKGPHVGAAPRGRPLPTSRDQGGHGGPPLQSSRMPKGGGGAHRVRLLLAIRPFQVNPPPQFLNRPGGAGSIKRISFDGSRVEIDGERQILSLTRPTETGATSFGPGEIGEWLQDGEFPGARHAEDPEGFASGVLAYDLELTPGRSAQVEIAIPLHGPASAASSAGGLSLADLRREPFAAHLARARRFWRTELGRVRFHVPPEAEPLVRAARSNLAYILIDRDGPALQPGARAYARAWIRDGALISAALLRFGIEPPVRDFLRWYAGYQYDDGKIPCCIDRRGADPVPENDSPGEFLFLVAEHSRFAGDRALLAELWPRVRKTVGFLDALRQQRRTERYRTEEGGIYFGLLPESISHEGYSSRPAHSYWDDFFALKGLKDAVDLAEALGEKADAARFAAIRDEFRADLDRSLRAAMAHHKIDFLPGSADLGDFDPTSTTIALNPVDEQANLPQDALHRTFERYWEEIERRLRGTSAWTAYTPYELRSVGAFVRLGWRERAHRLLAFFLGDLRPRPWNQWPEVVWRDPRVPGFLGDLPHAWVGSDYLRSFLDLFAYERAEDQALVIGAGLPASWLDSPQGVGIENLQTHYGTLSYSLKKVGGVVTLRLWGGSRVPPGGFVLQLPPEGAPKRVRIDGRIVQSATGPEIVLRKLPARVELVP